METDDGELSWIGLDWIGSDGYTYSNNLDYIQVYFSVLIAFYVMNIYFFSYRSDEMVEWRSERCGQFT